jgi:predicted Zn-dependent peptidase
VRTKDVYRAAELAVGILKSYKEKLLPPDALMKSSYVDNAYLLLDDVRDLNFTMAYDNHIMELGYASLAERSAAYEKITPEDIRRAACEIFKPENLTLAIKGNKKSINSERIKAIISSL